MPTGIRKRRCFVVVAFLGAAAIGIGVGLLVGYVLGRLHRGEGPPKPLPVRVERVGPDETGCGPPGSALWRPLRIQRVF
jgi:hypothetical protein